MNYLLKFKHQNGSAVWLTVYCVDIHEELARITQNIERRTSFKFTGDVTVL